MLSKINYYLRLLGICILLLCSSIFGRTAFWENNIYNALQNRDLFFEDFSFHPPFSPSFKITEPEQISLYGSESSPWFHILRGIHDKKKQEDHFQQAIVRCNNDPGELWLLFNTFMDINDTNQAFHCLGILEELKLEANARSVPIIYEHLLFLSYETRKNGNTLLAERLLKWAKHFEIHHIWNHYENFEHNVIKSPGAIFYHLSESLSLINDSWYLQIRLFNWLYSTFFYTVIFILLLYFTIVFLNYLPLVFHQLSDYFPLVIYSRIRLLMISLIFLASTCFGIVPFFLLFFFTFLPAIKGKRNRFFFSFSGIIFIMLLCTYPRIILGFNKLQSEQTDLGFFREISHSGYTSTLEQEFMNHYRINKHTPLNNLSGALLYTKKGDLPKARKFINSALSLGPADPLINSISAHIDFLEGKTGNAFNQYQQLMNTYPENPYFIFNTGQLKLMQSDATTGMRLIAQASEISPSTVNTFIERNALYFGDNWPLHRRLIIPEYMSAYFWSSIAFEQSGTWSESSQLYGNIFYSIDPLYVMAFFLIILFILKDNRFRINIDKYSSCKLCGKTTCIKCRSGELCKECVKITDEHKSTFLLFKINNRKKLISTFFYLLLNTISPGSGQIYRKNYNILTKIHVLVSAITIAIFIITYQTSFSVSGTLTHNGLLYLRIYAIAYFTVNFILTLKNVILSIKSLEIKYGI